MLLMNIWSSFESVQRLAFFDFIPVRLLSPVLQDMLRDYFNVRMIDGAVNDIRLIGTVTIVVLLIIAIIGMDWVARVRKIFYNRD